MSDLPFTDWVTHRQDLANTLGVDLSMITAYTKADGSMHIQVGKPCARNRQFAVAVREDDSTPDTSPGQAIETKAPTVARGAS